jgi:hypothetical protein
MRDEAGVGDGPDRHRGHGRGTSRPPDRELTLAGLARRIEAEQGRQPSQLLDPAWLKRMRSCWRGLKDLQVALPSRVRPARSRSNMGIAQLHGLHLGLGLHLSLQSLSRSRGPTTCSRIRPRWRWASSKATWRRWPTASSRAHGRARARGRLRPAEHEEFFRPLRLAAVLRRGVRSCARRWSRWAATARCTTSASRTCRAR